MAKAKKKINNETTIERDFDKPSRIMQVKNVKLLINDDTNETYANGMTVLHTSPSEFRLHFYDASFGDEKGPVGVVKSIVIIPPTLIRNLISALETNLNNYEDNFGKIEEKKISEKLLSKIEKFELKEKP